MCVCVSPIEICINILKKKKEHQHELSEDTIDSAGDSDNSENERRKKKKEKLQMMLQKSWMRFSVITNVGEKISRLKHGSMNSKVIV